MWEGRCDDS
ncbi:peptide synthase, partial [Pseudomonas fluorescens WH6]